MLVTAATAGIGLAIAHRLCSEGARVFICSRKQANVDEGVRELRSKYGADAAGGVPCSVSQPGELEKYVDAAVKFFGGGKIHGVVSNVGMNPVMGRVLDMEEKTYDKIMDTNVRSHFRLLKVCKPHLETPGAAIVLVSSVGGMLPNFPIGVYDVSKTALIALGRALATELGREGIRVNTICPGLVKTKMAEALWRSDSGVEEIRQTFLGRLGEPEDISGLAAFLLSADSRHITGEAVVITGGTHSRM